MEQKENNRKRWKRDVETIRGWKEIEWKNRLNTRFRDSDTSTTIEKTSRRIPALNSQQHHLHA